MPAYCVNCQCRDARVVNSRPMPALFAVMRRRECARCGSRWTTLEVMAEALPDRTWSVMLPEAIRVERIADANETA